MFHILFGTTDWIAVLAATMAFFLLGALWFAPFMFGKTWNGALGFHRPDWKPTLPYYVGPFLGCLIAAFVTEALIRALGVTGYGDAAILGAVLGLGYAATASFVNAITPTIPRPYAYGAITGSYHVTGIIISALVVTALR